MSDLMQWHLQSVSINGGNVNRQDVLESSYIETMDFDGPILMLKIHDTSNYYIDNLRIVKGAQLVATLGDAAGRYALFQETFKVIQAPLQGDTINLIAINEDTYQLLLPAAQPRYFNNKQPADIVRQFAPGLTMQAESLDRVGTWHLNSGVKPAVLLKRIAKDTGAKAWISRGKIYFQKIETLLKNDPAFVYEMNNPRAAFTINKMKWINQDHAATAGKSYRYMSYHERDGMKVVGDPSLPVKIVSDSDLGVLQGKGLTLIPKMDIEVTGNAGLQVGQTLKIVINRYDEENRENESIPQIMVVQRVTNFESRTFYLNRAILAVTSDATKVQPVGKS